MGKLDVLQISESYLACSSSLSVLRSRVSTENQLAARPAIMWVDAFVPGPGMICGIVEASATGKPKTPCTRRSGSTTASLSTPILHVPTACPKLAEASLAQTVEGMLIPDFTLGFDGAHDGCKIVIRAEIVAIDHGGILKVVAGQTDGTCAGGLHKSGRDGERVR